MKVDIRSGEIYNSRFTHGLYVKYGCTFAGENKDHHKSKESAKIRKNGLLRYVISRIFPILGIFNKKLGVSGIQENRI